jgi:hypothetical protein
MKLLIKLLLVLVLISSCGARKSQVSNEDIKIEETTKIKEEVSLVSEKNESLVDTTSIIEEEFTPIDSTKAMVIDKKNGVFKNARYKTSKTKKGISTTKKEDSVLNQKKIISNEILLDIDTKDKVTDKEESLGSYLWIIIIIVCLVLGYLEYKRL